MPPEQDETQVAAPTPAPAAAPAPTPAPAAEVPVDDFASAFAEFNTDPKPAATPTPTPTPAEPAKKPEGAAAAEPTPTPAPAPAASSESGDPAAAPTPAPAAAPPGYVSQDEFNALKTRLDEMSRAPAPAAAPTPAPAAAPPLFNTDEQAALAKYHEDWPDVAKGEALQRRAEYQQLVTHIFGQVSQLVQPLLDRQPVLEETVQLSELHKLIPDYDDVRDPVIEWVGKQPAYLKAAYEKVTGEGSPEDIADLCDRFRKETGWKAPVAAAAPAPTPAPAAAPAAAPAPTPAPASNAALPAAATAAAASLKPVKTGRTEPTAAQDPNDFDSAWKEFATP